MESLKIALQLDIVAFPAINKKMIWNDRLIMLRHSGKGRPFEIIVISVPGINYKKKGLQELIRRISQNQVEKVVVLYKDRLLRFGFELIEYIASLYNCEIEIIDNTEKSEQQELVEDLVQIITVFSCKLQGKRANKAKKLIRELIQEEADGKSHKSNVDTK